MFTCSSEASFPSVSSLPEFSVLVEFVSIAVSSSFTFSVIIGSLVVVVLVVVVVVNKSTLKEVNKDFVV